MVYSRRGGRRDANSGSKLAEKGDSTCAASLVTAAAVAVKGLDRFVGLVCARVRLIVRAQCPRSGATGSDRWGRVAGLQRHRGAAPRVRIPVGASWPVVTEVHRRPVLPLPVAAARARVTSLSASVELRGRHGRIRGRAGRPRRHLWVFSGSRGGGSAYALNRANGAGKSTISSPEAFDPAAAARRCSAGEPVEGWIGATIARRLAVVPQRRRCLSRTSVEEVVASVVSTQRDRSGALGRR